MKPRAVSTPSGKNSPNAKAMSQAWAFRRLSTVALWVLAADAAPLARSTEVAAYAPCCSGVPSDASLPPAKMSGKEGKLTAAVSSSIWNVPVSCLGPWTRRRPLPEPPVAEACRLVTGRWPGGWLVVLSGRKCWLMSAPERRELAALRMRAVLPIIVAGVWGKPTATQPSVAALMPTLSRLRLGLSFSGAALHITDRLPPTSVMVVQAEKVCCLPPTVSWQPALASPELEMPAAPAPAVLAPSVCGAAGAAGEVLAAAAGAGAAAALAPSGEGATPLMPPARSSVVPPYGKGPPIVCAFRVLPSAASRPTA